MEGDTSVEFALPAKSENVALVRHALSGFAEVLGMEGGDIADLKTVVTEACTNVVAHAYEPGTAGRLEVSAGVDDQRLVVTVRDFGRGIRPLADVERRSLRLGLALIAALTEGVAVDTTAGGGTTVTMKMPLRASSNGDRPASAVEEVEIQTRIDIATGAVFGPVLSRVISMFASRADFSVDRLSDAVLLSDAISAGSPEFPEGTATLVVTEAAGAFEVRIGPLGEDGGRRLLEGMRIPKLGGSLESLAEEVRVERGEDGEYVMMRISAAG